MCCDPVVAQPTTQQSLQLKLVPKQQCSDYLSQGLSVELCATGSCEPCSGYSGSPVLYKYADTYFLVSHEHMKHVHYDRRTIRAIVRNVLLCFVYLLACLLAFCQVGILSYGSSCDSSTVFPSAFVNVQRYMRWILENY